MPVERLLDLLVEGAWDWDLPAGIVRHNSTWCDMLGAGPELLVHDVERYWDFVHPDDRPVVTAAVQQSLLSGEALRVEYRMRRVDGREIWVADRGAVIERDADGAPLRMVGSVLDITAERQRLQSEHEAAQRLQLALRAGELGLWDWDYRSGRLVVNDHWRQMLGLAPDHRIESIDDWMPLVHPQDLHRLHETVTEVIEPPGGGDFALELRARHAEGHWVWLLDQGLVAQRDGEGRPLRVIGTHQDITQRKQTERVLEQQRQQLSTVIDSALDAIVTIDARQCVVVFNRAAERMFGVPAQEVIGRPFERFMPEAMRSGHRQRLAQFTAQPRHETRIASGSVQSMALRADGTRFPIEAAIARSGEGDGLLLTAIIRDVTEVQRARQALLEKERAEQANLAKSAFLSRVSHELRTPLNAILGFADLMREADPASARRQLDHLQQAGSRLLALVNDLLDLGQIESGRHPLDPRDVLLAPALAQVAEVCGADAQRRGVRLELAPHEAGLGVRADARALDQILLNLLSNALKFSPAGSTVRLRCGVQGERVGIEVTDEGPGIPPGRLGELFKPYSRLDAAERAVPGTGLGLTISLELARQMGGELLARPADAGGTCMCLLLPQAAGPAAGHAEGPLSAEPAAPDDAPGAGGHALIVEDDPASAVLMEHLLRTAGRWSVRVAAELHTALALIAQEPFDLVLTDMDLGGEDGIAVIRAVRALPAPRRGTVIAVTADAMAAQARRVMDAGADGCWSKPVQVQQVLAFLRADRSRWPQLLDAR